jgi:hypothetical protein
MIAIYINFETPISKITAAKLQKIGGYQVGCNFGTCWKLCEYSTGGEPCDFTEDECVGMAFEAALMLSNANIQYTIDKD